MIRDPSDGSVREGEDSSKLSRPPITGQNPAMASGLPLEPTKDKAKLGKSREWLRNYRLGTTTSAEISTVTTGDQRLENEAND